MNYIARESTNERGVLWLQSLYGAMCLDVCLSVGVFGL